MLAHKKQSRNLCLKLIKMRTDKFNICCTTNLVRCKNLIFPWILTFLNLGKKGKNTEMFHFLKITVKWFPVCEYLQMMIFYKHLIIIKVEIIPLIIVTVFITIICTTGP